jgi:hypothetical protein
MGILQRFFTYHSPAAIPPLHVALSGSARRLRRSQSLGRLDVEHDVVGRGRGGGDRREGGAGD